MFIKLDSQAVGIQLNSVGVANDKIAFNKVLLEFPIPGKAPKADNSSFNSVELVVVFFFLSSSSFFLVSNEMKSSIVELLEPFKNDSTDYK
jgi:hypothetical protein